MAAFALVLCAGACVRDDRFVIDNGFYLAVGFYGAQRFVWEFFKPYGALDRPVHAVPPAVAAIFAYAFAMIVDRAQLEDRR